MDIILLHRQKNSEEAIYAAKSLKNIKHDNLYVIGDKIVGTARIEHIRHDWARLSKYHDQISKLLQICDDERISNDFIATADDVFIMEPWQPVNYNRSTLTQHIAWRKRFDSYSRSLKFTEQWLKRNGYPTLSYELHSPFIYNKKLLRSLILKLSMKPGADWQIRSLYGNVYGVKTEYHQDFKNPHDPFELPILSTSKRTFSGELGKFIRSVIS